MDVRRVLVAILLALCSVSAREIPASFESSEDVQRINDKELIDDSDRRIVGGHPTTISSYPYQVSLRADGSPRCGAAIIAENWVITAAHCLRSTSAKSVTIKAGSSTLSGRGQVIGARRIITHEYFGDFTFDYDIGLIQLDSPLSFNCDVQPIDLASESDVFVGEATVSGWGANRHKGQGNNRLHQTSVTLISDERCKKLYRRGLVTDRMLCAGTGGMDACQGDSGGPLVKDGRLIGIVSWAIGCADASHPGVYTRITALRSWINEKTGL